MKIDIDNQIDRFFYGDFENYIREKAYVYVTISGCEAPVRVSDWTNEGKRMPPSRLRSFAEYFYNLGRKDA